MVLSITKLLVKKDWFLTTVHLEGVGSFEGFGSGIGVVTRLEILSGSSGSPSESSNGSICLTGEPQTPIIRDSLSPSGSSGHGRDDHGLEQMADNLSVSSGQFSDEGCGEVENIQGESSSCIY